MFKKSLIAMTIAGASLSATAGVLTFDVTETAATTILIDAEPAAFNGCALIAAKFNATIDLNGQIPDNTADDDIINTSDNGTVGQFETASNVVRYTGANACDVEVEADILVAASDSTFSAEGATANGVTISATLITGVGGVTDEDTIIITVIGGVVDENASAGAALGSELAPGSDFQLLGVVDNTILFTVSNGAQTGREIYNLTGLVVTADAGADSVSLSAATQNTANVQYDTSPSTELVVLETQYTSTIDVLLDGVIDVSTSRLTISDEAEEDAFGTAEELNEDTLTFSTIENSVNGNLEPDSVVVTIDADNGDFSWMPQLDISDDGNDITSDELATGLKLVASGNDTIGTVALNDAMDRLTVTILTNDGDIDAEHKLSLVVPGESGVVSLNETTYSGNLSAFDIAAELVLAPAMTALGEWTLNGSVVEVPYMPFGPNTQPILRHTNTGVQTGDISARYIIEGVNTTWQSVGVVVEDAEPGLVNLLTPVLDAIQADSGLTQGKVAIEITTNVPGDDVTVFAAAKINSSDSDRLTIGAF